MVNNIKDSVLPNINLRVFRREKTDMSLIYNNSELLSLSSGFDIIPSVYIGNKKLEAYIEKVRAKDSSENDICIFIPYKENGLNDEERYELTLMFSTKLKPYSGIEVVEVKELPKLVYSIIIEPRGILPSHIKDNKAMFSQLFGFDSNKNRWTKLHIIEEDDLNELIVRDNKVVELLEKIYDLLSKKILG